VSKFNQKDHYSKEIYSKLDSLNRKIRNTEVRLAKQLSYTKAVTDNIPGGLLTLKDNKIELFSKSVTDLLRKNSLKSINDFSDYPELKSVIENIKPGEKQVVRIIIKKNIEVLSFSCSEIRTKEGKTKIISFENIKPELDEQEITSYQKLIRVLTHEMMNTISPLISANETLRTLLSNLEFAKGNEITEKDLKIIEKFEKGIQLINDRTKGISFFIEKYRKLTKLPKPNTKEIKVSLLFDELIEFYRSEIEKHGISVITEINPENIQIQIDSNLIMQVLINLFKNSIEAFESTNKPQIVLKSFLNNNSRKIISISDNGCGISNEDSSEIFIPFYSTKKEGSGIGLSLSKQIMNLHKGDIVLNRKETETEFMLIF
jgi:nitrogen fixation/metabolism regulation signal transduction histidine kinase